MCTLLTWTVLLPVIPAEARAKLDEREAAVATLEADKVAAQEAAATAAKAQAEADEKQAEMVGPALDYVLTRVNRLHSTLVVAHALLEPASLQQRKSTIRCSGQAHCCECQINLAAVPPTFCAFVL